MEFTNNVAPSTLGGPNGITSIDPIKAFGHQITTNKGYFYFLLVLLVLSAAALHLLDTSRTGRAWRAVREDPLAAGMMTIPVNRLKLMAFSFGAVVAALAGTVFAAQQINVFPTDFDTPYLILIYAALILGGAGSIGGAILGGLLLSVMLDGFLRSPTEAGYLFYGVILLTLIVKMRPWRKLVAVLAATAVFGIVVHAIVEAISKSAVAGQPSGGWISSALHNWVVVPSNATTVGNIGFVVLLGLCVALRQLKDPVRTVLLVPTLYLAACVWEGVLVEQPSITRQILIGVILIVMMNARPQGLLGSRRVEVV
jgi:ABC-type branched-subunit amino acid transport system permease subunit